MHGARLGQTRGHRGLAGLGSASRATPLELAADDPVPLVLEGEPQAQLEEAVLQDARAIVRAQAAQLARLVSDFGHECGAHQ